MYPKRIYIQYNGPNHTISYQCSRQANVQLLFTSFHLLLSLIYHKYFNWFTKKRRRIYYNFHDINKLVFFFFLPKKMSKFILKRFQSINHYHIFGDHHLMFMFLLTTSVCNAFSSSLNHKKKIYGLKTRNFIFILRISLFFFFYLKASPLNFIYFIFNFQKFSVSLSLMLFTESNNKKKKNFLNK